MKPKVPETHLNYGLIHQEPRIQDYIFGAGSLTKAEVLKADGDWTSLTPTNERQNSVYFDTMACVTFSALNCIEMILNEKFQDYTNWSDRFTAKMSGTSANGNSLVNVADSIRKDGLCPEGLWVYPRDQRKPVFDRPEYYKEVPQNIKDEAKRFLDLYNVSYEWVPTTKGVKDLQEALKYGPLQITVIAWYDKNKDGVYESPAGLAFNHAVALVKVDDDGTMYVYDSYEPFIKKLESGFSIGSYGLRYIIDKKISPMFDWKKWVSLFKSKNDTKLIRNSQTGEVAWYYADSLRIAESTNRKVEMILQYLVRKEGVSVAPEEWDKFDKISL